MISDDDVERRLRRYRPVGPSNDLRDRIIDSAMRRPSRWREWIPAAAAFIAAVVCYTLAASARRDAAASVGPFDALDRYVRQSSIEDPPDVDPQHASVEWWLSLRGREQMSDVEPVQ